jgi:hypothetical protein
MPFFSFLFAVPLQRNQETTAEFQGSEEEQSILVVKTGKNLKI